MTPGATIAHYKITGKLGEGGMGAVYRAIDSKLNREVAIKVLPEAFADDPDRLARFTREAQVLAALNHPNIAAIYGVEERALVMELVQGEDLKGPLALETALNYARQIADALEAAHDKGIVHRDLKPANVKVTPAGVVKVLDFGLAKTAETAASGSTADSPTLTFRATQLGVIMGTAGYMSPEQAAGKPVDKRSDVWAFGVVLCELLTGRRVFDGETISHTLAAVLRDPIELATIPAPPPIRALLARCLERDPRRRLRDIGEARVAIETYLANPTPEPSPAPPARTTVTPWILAGLLALCLAAALWSLWRAPKPMAERPMIQLDLDAGSDEVLDPTISLDGTRVVFVSQATNGSHLATRLLDQSTIAPIPGTEGARLPFLSPDGRSVGFFANGQMKKLSLDGGAPVVLIDSSTSPGGGAWSNQGSIAAVLSQWTNGVVYGIPAVGGSAQPLTNLDPSTTQVSPHFLPRGKGLTFTRREWTPALVDSVQLLPPGGQSSQMLLKDAAGARYLDTGHLVFYRDGKILAAPFDLERGQVSGDAIPMVDEVAKHNEIPQFDVSSNGTLVYRHGLPAKSRVVRMDSSGKQDPVIAAPGSYLAPSLSPDGARLAVLEVSGGNGHILIQDVARRTAHRLTLDDRPQILQTWTPDSRRMAYRAAGRLWTAPADAGGQPEPLSEDPSLWLSTFSRDGKWAAGYRELSAKKSELWVGAVDRGGGGIHLGKPGVVAAGESYMVNAGFSPDGRMLVYMSNETGRWEVYVLSLTTEGRPAGGKWQISQGSGFDPVWPAAGNQIFFKDLSDHLIAVSYTLQGSSFLADPPRVWSPGQLTNFADRVFDIAPDGKTAIAVVDAESGALETHVRVILNFGDEIRRRLAGAVK